MYTLTNYLLDEAMEIDGKLPSIPDDSVDDPKSTDIAPEKDDAAGQNKMVSLVADIRKIMNQLSISTPEEVVEDSRALSIIDLIEALNTTEEVIADRLNDNMDEWKDDSDNEYRVVFQSIATQAKDTITTLFTVPHSGSETSVLPRFTHTFNSSVIDKLIEALKALGPESAKKSLPGIIEVAKRAVMDQARSSGMLTSSEALQLTTKYQRSRPRTIGKKHATTRTKRDRQELHKAIVG